MHRKQPSVIIWYCTTKCDYLCRHCWRYDQRDSKELDTNEAKSLIKSVAELKPRLFVFSGGEPLLREDIVGLIEFAKECNLNVAVEIRSAKLSEEMALILARNEIHACITVDAVSPQITDLICGFEGAHNRIMQTIQVCKDHGIEFGFNSAVQRSNFKEMSGIAKFAEDVGATTHHMTMLMPLGKVSRLYASMCLDSSRFIECLGDIYREEQRQGQCKIVVYEPIYLRFVKEAGGILPHWGRVCKIGEYLHINIDGSVLPCLRATLTMGNALEKPLPEIYGNMMSSPFLSALRNHKNLKEPCASCQYGDICGGCRVRAHALTGDWFASDPACPYQRKEGEPS